jgi:hypothetical protein
LIGANKLSNNIVKLQCKSPEDANTLRVNNVDWNTAYEGLMARKVKYEIVVHGIAKEYIDFTSKFDQEAIVDELQQGNTTCNLSITKVVPFRRKTTSSKHHSIVIFTHDPGAAYECIRCSV